jgi:uncharacterized membrane protein YhaH (DUF805 family)
MTDNPNVHEAPKSELIEDTPLGESAGIGRLRYTLFSIGLVIVFGIVASLFGSNVSSNPQELAAGLTMASRSFQFGISILGVFLAVSVYLHVLRLRNIGFSNWLAVVFFFPFLNLAFYFVLAALPAGFATHKNLDAAAHFVMGLFIVLCFAVPVTVVFLA